MNKEELDIIKRLSNFNHLTEKEREKAKEILFALQKTLETYI
jgi:hypothetical protein